MRKTEKFSVSGANPLWQIYRTVSFWKVFKNTLVMVAARYLPFMGLKHWVYRKLANMEIGENTAIAFMAMMDILYPEKIHIGKKHSHWLQYNHFDTRVSGGRVPSGRSIYW